MDISDVRVLARELMDQNGLADWDLTFDNAKRRAGLTNFTARTISLSRAFMSLYSEAGVREVVLHEIAHARVGKAHAHNFTWKAEASRLGAAPQAQLTSGPTPPAPYIGICPNGHRIERFRKPRRTMSCAKCSRTFNPAYTFSWQKAAMPAAPLSTTANVSSKSPEYHGSGTSHSPSNE